MAQINFNDFLGGPGVQLPAANPLDLSFMPNIAEADAAKLRPGIQLDANLMPGEWDWMNQKNLGAAVQGVADFLGEQPAAPSIPRAAGGNANLGGSTAQAIMTEIINRTPVAIPRLMGGA